MAADAQDGSAIELIAAVRPFLIYVLELNALPDAKRPAPESARAQLNRAMESSFRKIEAFGLSSVSVRAVRYALVAFADEFMQLEPGRYQDYWSRHTFQAEQFDEALAGVHFFDRLAELRREADDRVSAVYYLCLLLGFRGKYR